MITSALSYDLKHTRAWMRIGLSSRLSVYSMLAVIVLIVRATSWPISLIDPDEYAFILSAREVMNGHLPYTTFFDIKPVGVSVLLALVMKLGGLHLLTVRVFGALCVLVTSCCLYELMRVLSGRRNEAFGAAVLYIAFSVLFGGLATMTEIMLAPFTAAGVLLLAHWLLTHKTAHRPWLIGGAGLAFGIAVCIKLVPAIPATAVGMSVLLVALVTRRVRFVPVVLHGLLFSIGLLLPMTIAALVFFKEGDLQQWLFSNYGFMHLYAVKVPFIVGVTKLLTVFVTMWPLTLAAAIALLLDLRGGMPNRNLAIIAYAWLPAELIASIMPTQLFPHYFLMTLPPLCLLAAPVIGRIAGMLAPQIAPKFFAASLVAVSLFSVLPTSWTNLVNFIGRSDPQRQMADLVNRYTDGRKDSLLVLSYDFMADYFFTNTPLPNRVAIPLHLLGPQSVLARADGHNPLQEVLANDPRFILMDRTAVYQGVSEEDKTMVESKLSCCYVEAARLPQFWAIEPGTYHMRDMVLFLRNKTPDEIERHIAEQGGTIVSASSGHNEKPGRYQVADRVN